MEITQPDANGPAAKAARFNWLIVIALLTGPAMLALIGALLKLDGLATSSPLVGGLISGLFFGVTMARRFGKTILVKILLGLCCGAVFAGLTLGLGVTGCALGDGFKLD
jgi:hypothetical protein